MPVAALHADVVTALANLREGVLGQDAMHLPTRQGAQLVRHVPRGAASSPITSPGRIGRSTGASAPLPEGVPVPPRRPELFDERNARHARDNPDPDQAETIAWLRRDGEMSARMIASPSDAQLDRRAHEDPAAPELTTAEVIELRQIAHVRGHLASIRTVLADSLDA